SLKLRVWSKSLANRYRFIGRASVSFSAGNSTPPAGDSSGGGRWHTKVPPSGPARSGTRAAAIIVQHRAIHTGFQPSWVLVRTLDRGVTGVKSCAQGPVRGSVPASTPPATMSFNG